MSVVAAFLGVVFVLALVGGIAAAAADALDILRQQSPGCSTAGLLMRAAGATCVFLIGLGGAAVGLVSLAMAVAPR